MNNILTPTFYRGLIYVLIIACMMLIFELVFFKVIFLPENERYIEVKLSKLKNVIISSVKNEIPEIPEIPETTKVPGDLRDIIKDIFSDFLSKEGIFSAYGKTITVSASKPGESEFGDLAGEITGLTSEPIQGRLNPDGTISDTIHIIPSDEEINRIISTSVPTRDGIIDTLEHSILPVILENETVGTIIKIKNSIAKTAIQRENTLNKKINNDQIVLMSLIIIIFVMLVIVCYSKINTVPKDVLPIISMAALTLIILMLFQYTIYLFAHRFIYTTDKELVNNIMNYISEKL